MAESVGLSGEPLAAQADQGGLGLSGTIAGLSKTRHLGLPRTGVQFIMALAACDLIRLPGLSDPRS